MLRAAATAHLRRSLPRPPTAAHRPRRTLAVAAMGGDRAMLWFRKGLRLHDNPALLAAAASSAALYPVFVLDPRFAAPARVGVNRYAFLLESLADLDASLRARGSRLLVLRGDPAVVLPAAWSEWGVTRIAWEADTEGYAVERDEKVAAAARAAGLAVSTHASHTLWDPAAVIAANKGSPPLTYQAFIKVAASVGPPRAPAGAAPDSLPPPDGAPPSPVPTLADCEAYKGLAPTTSFKGGESAGLARLTASLADPAWVAAFEKPKTDPTALAPATTVLSPYLKFGSVSSAEAYARVKATLAAHKGPHTAPPVSLEGQLLWREFYYCVAAGTPNYGRQAGNAICRQIPWDSDPALLKAWEEGRTGFPWIDAAMAQLREEGWMHHLARHAVACFLTRGHLFQSWEAGAAVFDRLLLDADPALNVGNWLWLSASAFFHQYWRVYSPVSFAVKYDKDGAYVRRWVPALARMPAKYIYAPWDAPPAVQAAAGCIIGKDYPAPIVDAASAGKEALTRMKAAYEAGKRGGEGAGGGGGKKAKKG